MGTNQTSKSLYFLWAILISLFVFQYTKKANLKLPPIQISMQEASFNIDHRLLSITSMGQKRLISSLFWVHTLMESDYDHYKGKNLNSWMYLRFNTITELEPLFYEAYLFGGQYLSVVKDDPIGARAIYEKGLQNYPNDSRISFHNGFNYLFEFGDVDKAIQNYEVALLDRHFSKFYGNLPTLLSKLKASEESLEIAYLFLLDAYNREPDESPLKPHQETTLYSLKAEMDLDCLNNKRKDCSNIDFRGQFYIFDNDIYKAQDEWKPARVNRRFIKTRD